MIAEAILIALEIQKVRTQLLRRLLGLIPLALLQLVSGKIRGLISTGVLTKGR
jgi:hypothetical protein